MKATTASELKGESPPIPLPVNKVDDLVDILHTALEGGMSSEWVQVDHYKWSQWYTDGDLMEAIKPEVTKDYVLLQARDMYAIEVEGKERPWVDVTPAALEAATQWALTNYAHLYSWSVNTEGRIYDIDYDAIGADVILQKVVIGDSIYG